MLIIIEEKNKITKKLIHNFFEYEGIVIYYNDGYYIKLNGDLTFKDKDKNKQLLSNKYEIYKSSKDETINLYVYDFNDTLDDYKLYDKQDFIISANPNSQIINNDTYMLDYYLVFRDSYLETNYDNVLVNKKKYDDGILKSGNFVEFLGFNFFLFDDFLYINNFNVNNRLKLKVVEEKLPLKKVNNIVLNNYYENTKKGIKLDKLEFFNPPRRNNSRKLILQLGPSITMSLSMMMLAVINVYNVYLNNGSRLQMASYVLMPLTMLLSGILWPIIGSTSDKRGYKKEYKQTSNEYIEYLKEYENNLEKDISSYINEEKTNIFDVSDVDSKLFYISNKSKDFLTLFIGYEQKKLELDVKLTKDSNINEHLNRIKYRVNHIDNFPLYIDLKNNKKLTIISNTNQKKYFINRYLLELLYKYHYDDVYIAIYSKDKEILKDIFALPHFFYGGIRLTFINERQLQDINNLYLDRPLILLLANYTDIEFKNSNVYTIYFSDNKKSILKNSDSVIEFNNNSGILIDKTKTNFNYYEEEINFNKYYKLISNFYKDNTNKKVYSFNNFFNGVDIKNNYLNNKDGLIANFATINDELLSFDLHESKDGPHGLIGGSTGSGKSELIISLLLSLAIRYSPEYLNFILIDYKGGGIIDSLSSNAICIPHIIAGINNLESDIFERLIVSIDRECKTRQKLFKELSIKSSMSIMNIDDYLNIYKEYNFPSIAHELIIVDEFAELKKENPLIIKELVSFSRIGRSLGIHLILATQKPSGVIDDEIWANSHFKIALKVHSEKDSLDIIKSNEAAYLTRPGEFYLQVDDNTIKANAIYSKKDINNNDEYEVSLLNNKLEVIKKTKYKNQSPSLESTYFVNKIIETCNILNYKTNKLNFEKPKEMSINDIKTKYNIIDKIIMGEVDDYLNASRSALVYPKEENLLIYSSRTNEIYNLLNSLLNDQVIIISSSLYRLRNVSDSILYEDEDDILYLFNKLLNDNSTNIKLIVEDINSFLTYNDDYLILLHKLIRRSYISNYRIYILSRDSNINFKIINSIKNKLVIESYDNQDVINIFGFKSNYKGKSFFFNEEVISFIPSIIETIKSNDPIFNKYIDEVPKEIKYEYFENHLLIGINLKTRKPIYLKDNEELLITSFDSDLLSIYKSLYIRNNNVKVVYYSDDLYKENYSHIIFVGEGLYSQKLFYVDKEIELNPSFGLYYSFNKTRLIRMVNHE